MLFTAQHPNIFNQHRDCPVHVGDKLHMVGISVFFHRDRDLDAGVSVQLLFLEFLDRLLIFRRDRLVGEVVAVEFFIQLLEHLRAAGKYFFAQFGHLDFALFL